MTRNKLDKERMENGKFPAYAWPGGYPLFYLFADNAVCCPDCANGKNDSLANTTDPTEKQWYLVDIAINYEDDLLYCEHCNKQIESAYGSPDNDIGETLFGETL